MNDTTFDTDVLALELRGQFPEVLFAYLFGSSQEGKVRDGGDVDIAVWIAENSAKIDLIPKIVELVEKNTAGAVCDLVFLNDAGDQLAFSVLQGKILFIRDEARELHASFYSQTCRDYEDTVAWMKKQLQYRGYAVQWNH
jgi:predicted nucleotidyltransferase